MLAQALIVGREALVAGAPLLNLHKMPPAFDPQPWRLPTETNSLPPATTAVLQLQVSARAVLAEMELLGPLSFVAGANTASLTVRVGSVAASPLVVINLPTLDPADPGAPANLFDLQLQRVESYAALRSERAAEILSQVVPQTAPWSAVAALTPDNHRFTWELLGIGLRFAMIMVMRFKHHFQVLRPNRRSPVIQPLLLTPGYTAYPCGHATEASFVAELLPLLARDPNYPSTSRKPEGLTMQLNRLAFRIAENRVVAGLHYPVDSIAGQALGVMLARYFAWLADEAHLRTPADFTIGAVAFPKPNNVAADCEPAYGKFVDDSPATIGKPTVKLTTGSSSNAPAAEILRVLWSKAQSEWL